jgi:hypothetical protein
MQRVIPHATPVVPPILTRPSGNHSDDKKNDDSKLFAASTTNLPKPRPTFRKPREIPLSPDTAARMIQQCYRDYRFQQELKATIALEDLLSDPKNGKKVTSLDET